MSEEMTYPRISGDYDDELLWWIPEEEFYWEEPPEDKKFIEAAFYGDTVFIVGESARFFKSMKSISGESGPWVLTVARALDDLEPKGSYQRWPKFIRARWISEESNTE
jgi:hypothetical protein